MCAITLTTLKSIAAESSNDTLLKMVHKYGVTKCDRAVIENSSLKGNWDVIVERHTDGISKDIKEVTIIQTTGSKNDTIKLDHSYIQTPKACLLHRKSTLTFAGPCSSNIDLDHWYISKEMPDKDYTEYKSAKGALLLAKEVSVGNFKICIQEYSGRFKYDIK